jgi:hypothetical protein
MFLCSSWLARSFAYKRAAQQAYGLLGCSPGKGSCGSYVIRVK